VKPAFLFNLKFILFRVLCFLHPCFAPIWIIIQIIIHDRIVNSMGYAHGFVVTRRKVLLSRVF
jgi:hypothetical protein